MSVINRLPRSVSLAIGSGLGLVAWRLLSKDRYRIHRHLRLVFGGHLDHDQKRAVARSFFTNSGRNFTDVLRLRDHFKDEIMPLVEVEGLEHFEAAHRKGRGIIGVTGHLGNFELLAVAVVGLGYRCAAIARRMYEPRLDQMLVANREAHGLVNFPTTASPRKLLRWLKDGNVLGVLIDFDSISVRGTFVPSLGRLALTPIGQTMIGLRAGAAFVPVACVRIAGDRYRIIFRPEIDTTSSGDFEADVQRVTADSMHAFDDLILRYPEQWIWLKNRWLTPTSYQLG